MINISNFINEWKLFFRSYSSKQNNKNITDLLSVKLNWHNVHTWSVKQTNKNFILGLEQDYLAYRFEVLRDWINHNEYYNESYTGTLNKIIKVLKLELFLKAQEVAYIEHINAINFAKKRSLKSLIVDFDLQNSKEIALFSFEDIDVFQIDITTGEKIKVAGRLKMFITNQSLVFGDMLYHFRIQFEDSLAFKLNDNGVLWQTKKIDYEFKCSDKYLLYTCLRIVIYNSLNNKTNWMWKKGIGVRD